MFAESSFPLETRSFNVAIYPAASPSPDSARNWDQPAGVMRKKLLTPEQFATHLYEWNPGLNTRADLTLKKWIAVPIAEPDLPTARPLLRSRSGYEFLDPTCSAEQTQAVGKRVIRLREDEDVRATVVRAMHRLNYHVLKGRRRTARLNALVFWEHSAAGQPHVHALLERPADMPENRFADFIARSWDAQPFANREKKIEPVVDLYRSIRYNSKFGQDRLIYFHKEETACTQPLN